MDSQSQKQKLFLEGSIAKALFVLALPIVLTNLLQSAYQLIDSFWVGRLGAESVAAVSVSFPLIFLMTALGAGFSIAGSTLVAQYVGAKNNAIHNTIIGNRCGQVNHGSGNIFIGSETVLATSATSDVETTYSNKFAIYKTNFYGVPSEPLVGGDFSTGTVGINTIDPDTYLSTTTITETDTKLIIK